jgi:flagellar hook assembly protein FlgD
LSTVSEEISQPGWSALGAAYPNPFNPRTTIRYHLPQAAAVDISVLDLAGRRVVRLVRGERQESGTHYIEWDGRDHRGRMAPAGVYLYRLQAGSLDETRRMVLLK